MSNYSYVTPIGGKIGVGGMEGTLFSNSSMTVTEHMMERSFDDDKRNMFEQIKSLLIAKLQVI